LQRAQQAYEQALEKAPGVIDAKIGIASVLLAKIASAWRPFLQQDLTRVEKLLLEAIEQNANNAWARSMMGRLPIAGSSGGVAQRVGDGH
jgi:cytochrome c-type biogenesis protein CcmH/NrfG